jgi:hypothetical protein
VSCWEVISRAPVKSAQCRFVIDNEEPVSTAPKRASHGIDDLRITGVIIQFPLYAVIFGTGLSDKGARLLTSISTHDTFALLVALYSATLGVFTPSGGSKRIIEAPCVLQAAIEHCVNLGWVVQIYNASEAAEPDQSILRVAAARHPTIARAGPRRLRPAPTRRASPGSCFSCAGFSPAPAVHPPRL